MNELGIKIKLARKAKGFSQEKLSDTAQINLRTLQRIEKGETNPYGDTLLRISKALEIPIEELMDYGLEQNVGYIRAMHFAALSLVIFPLGNIILPLIMWLIKKNKIKNISFFAKNLLNFQITWTIIVSLPYLWKLINMIFSINLPTPSQILSPFTVLMLYFAILFLINIIYILSVGIILSDKLKNYFPVAIRLLK